ncbi:methyltransferase domain-containing protein [Streptomyces xiaopingdaonensis]|uniref:methyltransferase domain-containing protein n=1 Tax=Streptomyces xiaopingdaonensis TaxID=1565415 RepID=UPI0002D5997F|nr:class I SAM-dependent methyltransferase [Streptomyces xiaopingdaonensis]
MSTTAPPTTTHPWSADPYATALRTGTGPLYLRRSDGWLLPLEVERWCGVPDPADLSALRRCEGPVLDVGCGPGRLARALSTSGTYALGIDVNEAAVAHASGRGAHALHRSVFDSLPYEGSWRTGLLLDGNIGISGDAAALLARLACLVAPGGLLLVETATVEVDERVLVRFDDGRGGCGTPFPWARVGPRALHAYAGAADWSAVEQWTASGRAFTALRRT